jgi:hypothetical protein
VARTEERNETDVMHWHLWAEIVGLMAPAKRKTLRFFKELLFHYLLHRQIMPSSKPSQLFPVE